VPGLLFLVCAEHSCDVTRAQLRRHAYFQSLRFLVFESATLALMLLIAFLRNERAHIKRSGPFHQVFLCLDREKMYVGIQFVRFRHSIKTNIKTKVTRSFYSLNALAAPLGAKITLS
jgi:hypothetical protein